MAQKDEVAGSGPRFLFEFLIAFLIVANLVRTFVAEAYLVPSGSMAPKLMGFHKNVKCPSCGFEFAIGVEPEDDFPIPQKTTCPICGDKHVELSSVPLNTGDRVLVQKGVYDFRKPRRWEQIVFRHPEFIQQPYIKRVVGLPGETVKIQHGDIYIDGKIVRKSYEEFLSMCIPVVQSEDETSSTFVLPERQWIPQFQTAAVRHTHWTFEGGRINGEARSLGNQNLETYSGPGRLEYRLGWPAKPGLGVEDDLPYNARRDQWQISNVTDLLLRCKVSFPSNSPKSRVEFLYRFPGELHSIVLDAQGQSVLYRRNGKEMAQGVWKPTESKATELAFGFIDRRFLVRLGGVAPFPDVEIDKIESQRPTDDPTDRSPFAIDVLEGAAELTGLRIDRDIHYSDKTTGAHHGHGVTWPTKLKEDEYFVLGDNSTISNDSRIWDYPGVAHKLLIGKPIMVHLPTKAIARSVFGKEIHFSVPDFGRMQMIR